MIRMGSTMIAIYTTITFNRCIALKQVLENLAINIEKALSDEWRGPELKQYRVAIY